MANYFDSETVAARYARVRPVFHRKVLARLFLLSDHLPFERALDVGCGTGASTSVLREIASRVVGVDPSLPMLQRAAGDDTVAYVGGVGERLPFHDRAFDLITTSLAFHWMDESAFLSEAARILRAPGFLVVYDNYFMWNPDESDELVRWVFEVYRSKLPAPPRGHVQFEVGKAHAGFRCLSRDEYDNPVSFSQEQLIDYLLTQTNVIAAVADGAESFASVETWLKEQTAPFFPEGKREIPFGGPIWVLGSVARSRGFLSESRGRRSDPGPRPSSS